MNKFEAARLEEIEYHEKFYQEVELFQPGTWLARPVRVVMESLAMLNSNEVSILDLGCGVGRNSIPLAQQLSRGKVVCVDLLKTALSILKDNSKKYKVEQFIIPVLADVEHYEVELNTFNLIVACSCLEHVSSEETFIDVVNRMKAGTKDEGINCILMSTEVRELDIANNEEQEGNIELNLTMNRTFELLNDLYRDWHIIKTSTLPQEIREIKGGKEVSFKSNWITFVARRRDGII